MGYACPVCETPQRDGEHLANHLAFTAMLHGDDHEAWLDEHVDSWGDRTPGELAADVTDHATETEYDEVFEDTTDDGQGHNHGRQQNRDHGIDGTGRPDVAGEGAGDVGGMAQAVTDEAVESVIAEAQELTEEMYEADAEDSTSDTDKTGETADSDGSTEPDTADETDDREGEPGSAREK